MMHRLIRVFFAAPASSRRRRGLLIAVLIAGAALSLSLLPLPTPAAELGPLSAAGLSAAEPSPQARQTAPSQQPARRGRSVPAQDIAPIRIIKDPYPIFAGVAVDAVNDEVVFSDNNTFNLLVYSRTVPGDKDAPTEYRRKIGGPKTKIQYTCGVAMDPVGKEIFALNPDAGDNMLVFPYGAAGDVAPARELRVDHGAWGISLDREHQEIAMTIEHLNKISVYSQKANGNESTLRYIQGPKTGLSDPHGIFTDTKNNEFVVTNQHSSHEVETGVHAATLNFRHQLQSTGRFVDPSVTVYSRTAEGNVTPLRRIQGPSTRLAVPLGVFVDVEKDLIAVANDQTHSILFFSRTANGDAAPVGVIEGPATGLRNPAWVYIDSKNNEIWVTNSGDHSATIYDRNARGNAAPLRTIRTAARGLPWGGLGKPSSIAYDGSRDEILVPN